jgi:isoquinoline 1-oxidoreductase alpha subunit
MIILNVNDKEHRVEVAPDTPLLWVLREQLRLTGTKYGCGQGLCGACTVLIDGQAEPSCQIAAKDAVGMKIVTIEGLAADHPLKTAWIAEEVPQCGWCQPGQIMQAADLLSRHKQPTDADIDGAMAGNLCRCGTYPRIRRAIHRAAGSGEGRKP